LVLKEFPAAKGPVPNNKIKDFTAYMAGCFASTQGDFKTSDRQFLEF